MNCSVNGKTLSLEDGTTVLGLLEERGLKQETVVVELNRTVLERDAFITTVIPENAEVEILSFVGGGLCE